LPIGFLQRIGLIAVPVEYSPALVPASEVRIKSRARCTQRAGFVANGPPARPGRLSADECRMNKIAADPAQPYRSLIAGYTDAIRMSDFKANIALLFGAFMMGPVLGNYALFPSYLPIPFVLLPFLIMYICLLAVLIPRYPKRGAKHFIVSRNTTLTDFAKAVEADDELEQLKLRCSVLSGLLWWKTFYIRVGFFVAMVGIIASVFLIIHVWYF
jgi:hypothetical protein